MDGTNTRGPVKRSASAARAIGVEQSTIEGLRERMDARDSKREAARSASTELDFVGSAAPASRSDGKLSPKRSGNYAQQLRSRLT